MVSWVLTGHYMVKLVFVDLTHLAWVRVRVIEFKFHFDRYSKESSIKKVLGAIVEVEGDGREEIFWENFRLEKKLLVHSYDGFMSMSAPALG